VKFKAYLRKGCFLFMVHLWFDRGTILLSGEVGTPYGKWDPRMHALNVTLTVVGLQDALTFPESRLSQLWAISKQIDQTVSPFYCVASKV
jgi:hypothetical protein